MRRLVLGLIALTASAQAPASFDAASIKISGSQSVRGSSGGPGTSDPGQYVFTRATMLDLIAQAYGVGHFQISSSTPLDRVSYDLLTKIPAGATKEQFHSMLRALLAERFHLLAHTAPKEMTDLVMIVAKGGPKWKESPPTDETSPRLSLQQHLEGGFLVVRVTGAHATAADLAAFLPQPDAPPIRDQTGLSGRFDFVLDYTRERDHSATDGSPGVPPSPDLTIALRQQLGLQLVPQRRCSTSWLWMPSIGYQRKIEGRCWCRRWDLKRRGGLKTRKLLILRVALFSSFAAFAENRGKSGDRGLATFEVETLRRRLASRHRSSGEVPDLL